MAACVAQDEATAMTAARPPGFWRTLFAPRKARAQTDAYAVAVFESKGFTREEAVRATREVRLATRGIPHSPWFKERWQEVLDGKP